MNVPTSLYVPLPAGNSGKRHGVYSMRGHDGQRVIIRILRSDRDIIKQAAELLNMSEAQFVRESSLNTAKVIRKHMEEHNADASDRSG